MPFLDVVIVPLVYLPAFWRGKGTVGETIGGDLRPIKAAQENFLGQSI